MATVSIMIKCLLQRHDNLSVKLGERYVQCCIHERVVGACVLAKLVAGFGLSLRGCALPASGAYIQSAAAAIDNGWVTVSASTCGIASSQGIYPLRCDGTITGLFRLLYFPPALLRRRYIVAVR